jgi:tyrosine-protein kinase Etk/Wzc
MSDLVQVRRRDYPAPPAIFTESHEGSWAEHGEPPEEGLNLRDVFATIRRNLWLILGVALAVTGATAYMVRREAPVYKASALIRLADMQRAMTGDIGSVAKEGRLGLGSDPLLSQLEVLKGREVLGKVVDREGLRLVSATPGFPVAVLDDVTVDLPPDVSDSLVLRFRADGVSLRMRGREVAGPYGAPLQAAGVSLSVPSRPAVDEARLRVSGREGAIDQLSRGLVARPKEKTDAVQVEYTASHPRHAQQIVNAAVEVFQAENAEAAQRQSRRRRVFLEGQLRTMDSVLASAQATLSSFRSREEVYSSREKLSAQQQGIFALQVRREELVADRQMYQSLLAGLSGNEASRNRALRALASSPGISENQVISQLYTRLTQYQGALDSLTSGSTGSTAEHPDVQRLNALSTATEGKLIEALRSQMAVLDARITALNNMQSSNSSEIRGLPVVEAEEQRAVQQVETTRKIADAVREELQKARMAEAVEAGQVEVVYNAPLPHSPISTGKNVKLAMGLMFGLLLGGAAAFVREQLNSAIRGQDEIQDVLRIPGLAIIPRLTSGAPHRSRFGIPASLPWRRGTEPAAEGLHELVTISNIRSSGAEAYRTLRTNLIFSQAVRTLRTMVVTSSAPSEGKTTTASNLAVSFAQQGLRVLLVDCDLRKARLHKVFALPREPGLTQLLMGHNTAADVIRSTPVEGLHVLTSGILPPNPSELLGGPRMANVLKALSSEFDLVVLDTPPLTAAADAAILGKSADGVLMVVRAGQTERGAAQHAVQQLNNVGARILGAVLNDPDAKVPRYGGYYYYDYYGSEA